MKQNENLKDYRAIEGFIREARIERTVVIAQVLANAVQALGGFLQRVLNVVATGLDAERDRRAIEADAFLKRSIPRYW